MTAPDHSIPEGATTIATLSDLQALDEEKALAQLRQPAVTALDKMREALTTHVIGGIGKAIQAGIAGAANTVGAFFEDIFTAGSVVKDVKDGQEKLAGRADLLEFVRGFCAAYQSVNVNSEWNIFSDNSRYLPYDAPLGPSKGAHVEAGKNIVLDEAGLWLVVVYAHAQSTSFSGGNLSAVYIDVVGPDGDLVRSVTVDIPTAGNYGSIPGVFLVPIPEPGCWIRVRAWSGRWRWWSGGARNAWMNVVKFDNRFINPGQDTVPNESKPSGA